MNLDALKRRLSAEGYDPLLNVLRPWGLMIQDLYLMVEDGRYTLAWTERGEIVETLYAGVDEEVACDRFHEVVSDLPWHFRTFRDAAEADVLTERLKAAGVTLRRNDIPDFNGPGDARFRIFVLGRDLARAGPLAG